MKEEKLKTQKKISSKSQLITRERYDNVWKVIFSVFLILSFIGIFYLIRDISKFRSKLISLNPNYDFPKMSDFKICIPLFIIISLIKYIAQKYLVSFCSRVMKKSYRFPTNEKDRQLGERYKYKLPDHIFKGSMYLFLTLFGYYVLKDLNYFPKALLGKGSLPNMFVKGYPNSFYLEKPPLFNFYYMLCLSYFSSDAIWLIFINAKQSDFIKMFLHHVCTISLIIFSYLVNYSNVGSLVLLLHIATDIFVHLTRFSIQTDLPDFIKLGNGIALYFSFIYLRMYVLGKIIYVLYYDITWKGVVDSFLLFFLIIIFFMHIDWIIMLTSKFVDFFMGKGMKDTREYKVNVKEPTKKE